MHSLIDRILNGDEAAVAQFYKQYSSRILRYLKSKLPNEDAEEILNDVFLETIDALPTLRKKINLRSFLYRVAHNKMVNFYRKRKIKSMLLSQIPLLALFAKEILQPEFQLEKNEIRDRIERAVHILSSKYRRILHLR